MKKHESMKGHQKDFKKLRKISEISRKFFDSQVKMSRLTFGVETRS